MSSPPAQNAVATKRPSAVAVFKSKISTYQPQMATLLPKGSSVTPERLTELATIAAIRNPDILGCTISSVVLAVLRVAQLGLELGATAHIVPFGTKAECIIGYQGFIELAIKSGHVVAVEARLHYPDDLFQMNYGTTPSIDHAPSLEAMDPDNAPLPVGVYAVAHIRGGGYTFDYMTFGEVERVRQGKDGPWMNHWGEMAKKTVVRRLMKMLPRTPELTAALHLADRQDGYTNTNIILDAGEYAVSEVDGQTLQEIEE